VGTGFRIRSCSIRRLGSRHDQVTTHDTTYVAIHVTPPPRMTVLDAAPSSVFQHRPFLFYWAARTSAAMAWQIQAVAVGWQMYELTNDAFDLGLVGLAEFLPLFLFILAVGPVADRFNRRRIIQICQTVEAIAAAFLALGTASGSLSKEMIFAAVFLLGSGRAFELPTSLTLVPALVPTQLLPQASAAASSATQFAVISGPAIGGLLYAFSPTLVYALCASLFVLSVLLLTAMRLQQRTMARVPLTPSAVFAGVGYIRNNSIVLGAMSLDLFAVLLGGAVALLPIYARDILEVGPSGLGVLRAAPAVGALTVVALMSRTAVRKHVGRYLFVSIATFGVATIAFALSRSFALSLLALIALGASDSISVVIRATLVQLETIDEMRGRVTAVYSLFVGTSNALGAFRAGTMASFFGVVPAVLIGGVGTLIVAGLWMRLFRPLYAVDSYPPQRMSAERAAEVTQQALQETSPGA
jgi:MFS family permease